MQYTITTGLSKCDDSLSLHNTMDFALLLYVNLEGDSSLKKKKNR